jgi:hypothetical protein
MSLLIFYLTDANRHFTFEHFISMLNQSAKKNSWKLLVITSAYDEDFYAEHLKSYPEIQSDTFRVDFQNNYMKKAHYAVHYAEKFGFPYLMKCDNDLFIKAEVLDYMVDNISILDNSRNLTLGPTLTSGIPGVEYFKEQFLDQEAQDKMDSMFLKSVFKNEYGADYTFLNKYTLGSTSWNKLDFFESVYKMNHHYKGIHPIRVNEAALQFLNQYIIDNKARFLEPKEMDLIFDNFSPYLCNSVYCIKTETYKTIINDESLFVDIFDEVPLNKYAWKNASNHVFVKNGFTIHMYYNWKPNYVECERQFCEKFFGK